MKAGAYEAISHQPRPFRCRAPETFKRNSKYTEKTELWAFGIFICETWDFGIAPFGNMDAEDVVRLLDQGITPIPPKKSAAENVMQIFFETLQHFQDVLSESA